MDRTHELLIATVALGLLLYAYGLAVALGLLPAGWGPVLVTQYALMVVGGLLVWLIALVVLWSRFLSGSGLLTERDRLAIWLLAPVATIATTMGSTWLSSGLVSLPHAGWTVLGLVVLSFQFYLGTLTPKRLRRRILTIEPLVVFVLIFLFLAIDRSTINLSSFLFVSGGATLLLVLGGGPLYLLGTRVGDGTPIAREA